jgi:hypothetical protein
LIHIPNVDERLSKFRPDIEALKNICLTEVTNPFLILFKGETPGQIWPETVDGWIWDDQTPAEFREEQRENATSNWLSWKKAGDFGVVGVVAERGGYAHKGVALGDGTVVHFSGEPKEKRQAAVIRTLFRDFQKNSRVAPEYPPIGFRLNPGLSALIALRYVGLHGYNLADKNCEHFMELCLTGEWYSHQMTVTRKYPLKAFFVRAARLVTRYGLNPDPEIEEKLRSFQDWPGGHRRFLLEPDGTRLPFWLGDLWRDEEHRIHAQIWTRIPWDTHNLHVTVPYPEGGCWSEGPPWRQGNWSMEPPKGRLFHLAEIWFDDHLQAYLRSWWQESDDSPRDEDGEIVRIRRWYTLGSEVDLATCLAPVHSNYPPLPPLPSW